VPKNIILFTAWPWQIGVLQPTKIGQTLEISQERLGFIIHDVLDMKKLSAKLVTKCSNEDQERDRVVVSQVLGTLDGTLQYSWPRL
jgi:hypothetical protein